MTNGFSRVSQKSQLVVRGWRSHKKLPNDIRQSPAASCASIEFRSRHPDNGLSGYLEACSLTAKSLDSRLWHFRSRTKNFTRKSSATSRSAIFLARTCLVGTVMFPTVSYFSIGQPMTANEVYDLAIEGFLLGSVVAFAMYMAFKFLLGMGWLPSRH